MHLKGWPCRLTPICLLALLALGASAGAQGTMRYLDNGQVRVGIDLAMGGAITYLSLSGSSRNIVNSHDPGREIQQSYYSGPNNFGWWSGQPWPWNPISVGDQWGNYSQVLDFQTDGTTLYTKIIPMQWGGSDPAGIPGDCTFENWVTLDANVVHVCNRLNNARSDRNWYGAYQQELPAVYTIGQLYRLWTYDGTHPFESEPPVMKPNVFMWSQWRATEGWAAQLDDSGWGLGVYASSACIMNGGFHPEVNASTILAGPKDDPTSYMAPVHAEVLDWNITYEYAYDLILGTLDTIRTYVYQHRFDPLPHAVFAKDRRHWTYHNARDAGWPIDGRLVVDVGMLDPIIEGPVCGYLASECPSITIRMAAHLNNPLNGWLTGQVFWERDNGALPFSETQSIRFPIINDGQFHDYVVPLSSVAAYSGFISRLRFDPVAQGRPGDFVEIAWISCRPTALSVADVSARIGETVTLAATLSQGGAPVLGRQIAFSVDGTPAGSAATDGSGVAALGYVIPEGAGAGVRTIVAAFAGDDLYAPSSGSGTLTVDRGSTTMYVPDREGIITTPTILRAFLYRQPGDVGVLGRNVAFAVAGTGVGSALTEASGRASLQWIIDAPPGDHVIRAEFSGDGAYEPAAGEATLHAGVAATKVYVPDRAAKIKRTAVLRAYLYDLASHPVAGRIVSLRLDGTEVGSAPTSATGRVQIFHTVPEGAGAGQRAIQGVFAGTAGYLASSGTGTLTVERGDVYLWPLVRSGKRGAPHPLSAYLRSLPDYSILPGKQIAFAVDGTALGSASVADTGWATLIWNIPPDASIGEHMVNAAFAGDASYNPADVSAPFQVVP